MIVISDDCDAGLPFKGRNTCDSESIWQEKGICSYLLTCCATSEDGIFFFFFDLAWPSFIPPNCVRILPRGPQFLWLLPFTSKNMCRVPAVCKVLL